MSYWEHFLLHVYREFGCENVANGNREMKVGPCHLAETQICYRNYWKLMIILVLHLNWWFVDQNNL